MEQALTDGFAGSLSSRRFPHPFEDTVKLRESRIRCSRELQIEPLECRRKHKILIQPLIEDVAAAFDDQQFRGHLALL